MLQLLVGTAIYVFMNMDFVHSRFYDSIWFDIMIMYGSTYGNPAMVNYVCIHRRIEGFSGSSIL